jgi:CheY-like chemotaxis protein
LKTDSCRVLVVDADRENANSSVTLLQLWGHEAEAAYSAEDAIAKALALDPDVVLVDLVTPTTNGTGIANELRQVCPAAKFLATTGFARADIVRRSREAGIATVLMKPVPAKVLQEAVETECAAVSK